MGCDGFQDQIVIRMICAECFHSLIKLKTCQAGALYNHVIGQCRTWQMAARKQSARDRLLRG
jgi:hypothetical protein